jgi:hypothetical protein
MGGPSHRLTRVSEHSAGSPPSRQGSGRVGAVLEIATSAQVDVHKHMPALDGVRGVAVVLVILHHAYPFTTLRHPVDQAL